MVKKETKSKAGKVSKLEQHYEQVKKTSKAGAGERFAAMKKVLAAKGAKSPGGLAAYIGRKKYGKKKMSQWSAQGRKKDKPKND
ncbi:hypothetical protein KY315_00755 [Candidatus Woesearchaeota archaeon]|nr:hypothetical protein [Candidatus Woesearchaeota archaeon]